MRSAAALLLVALPAAGQATRPDGPPPVPGTPPAATRPAAPAPPADAAGRFMAGVEKAHGADRWRDHEVLKIEIEATWEGEPLLRGTLAMDLRADRARIETDDGQTLVFDGRSAWVFPAPDDPAGVRWHLRAWPFLIRLPFALRDPGVSVAAPGPRALRGVLCDVGRLTFAAGVGDAPRDRWELFADPRTGRLHGAIYVSTLGLAADAPDPAPGVVLFEEYREVEGVLLPARCLMLDEAAAEAPGGGVPLGVVRLANPRFVATNDALFARPVGSVEDPAP